MEWYSTVAREDKNNAFNKVTKRKLGLLNEKISIIYFKYFNGTNHQSWMK